MMDDGRVVVTYIDDNPVNVLCRYLDDRQDELDFKFNLLVFNASNGYESILKSDIIIMDDRLYEMSTKGQHLTGSEMKALISLVYPYKKTIVISQYSPDVRDSDFVAKKPNPEARDVSDDVMYAFYDHEMRPILEKRIEDVRAFAKNIKSLGELDLEDKLLIQDAQASLNGIKVLYGTLKSEDIDKLAQAVRALVKNR